MEHNEQGMETKTQIESAKSKVSDMNTLVDS